MTPKYPDAKRHIEVLIPSGRGLWPIEFSMSLIGMIMHMMENPPANGPTAFNIASKQSSTLQQSREDLVYQALEDGATHLLFLDDDHTFPADLVHHLLSRHEPVVGANYVRRTVPTRPVGIGLDGKPVITRQSSTGLEHVRYLGLGCCMIEARVFKGVPEPWFDFIWSEPNPETGRVHIDKSEDVFMFDKLREHGWKCMVDHDLTKHVTHLGTFQYGWEHGIPEDELLTSMYGGGS